MALISRFISSRVMTLSSHSTRAVREGSDTDAEMMPSSDRSRCSTLAEQAEQAIPITGIVFF